MAIPLVRSYQLQPACDFLQVALTFQGSTNGNFRRNTIA